MLRWLGICVVILVSIVYGFFYNAEKGYILKMGPGSKPNLIYLGILFALTCLSLCAIFFTLGLLAKSVFIL